MPTAGSTLRFTVLVFLVALCSSQLALAKAVAKVPQPDLAGMIACKKSIEDWQAFGRAFLEPQAIESWGWHESQSDNGFLKTFTLDKPIVVFGERVSQIAFSGSGVVAFLKSKLLAQLVRELKLDPIHQGPTVKLFGRLLQTNYEKAGSSTLSTKISLTASTSPNYPGFVLAGCSYEFNVE